MLLKHGIHDFGSRDVTELTFNFKDANEVKLSILFLFLFKPGGSEQCLERVKQKMEHVSDIINCIEFIKKSYELCRTHYGPFYLPEYAKAITELSAYYTNERTRAIAQGSYAKIEEPPTLTTTTEQIKLKINGLTIESLPYSSVKAIIPSLTQFLNNGTGIFPNIFLRIQFLENKLDLPLYYLLLFGQKGPEHIMKSLDIPSDYRDHNYLECLKELQQAHESCVAFFSIFALPNFTKIQDELKKKLQPPDNSFEVRLTDGYTQRGFLFR